MICRGPRHAPAPRIPADHIAVNVLRANSRVMVDGLRPSARAMARALEPCCFMLAIVIRSSGWSWRYCAVWSMCTPYAVGVALQIW